MESIAEFSPVNHLVDRLEIGDYFDMLALYIGLMELQAQIR